MLAVEQYPSEIIVIMIYNNIDIHVALSPGYPAYIDFMWVLRSKNYHAYTEEGEPGNEANIHVHVQNIHDIVHVHVVEHVVKGVRKTKECSFLPAAILLKGTMKKTIILFGRNCMSKTDPVEI